MHVSLPPALEEFVRSKIASGLYDDASEVVREALRLMREHEEVSHLKLARLREALAEGEADLAAGRFVTLSGGAELTEFFARL